VLIVQERVLKISQVYLMKVVKIVYNIETTKASLEEPWEFQRKRKNYKEGVSKLSFL